MESNSARAIRAMQKYDPSFDLVDLHFEIVEIFKEFFSISDHEAILVLTKYV